MIIEYALSGAIALSGIISPCNEKYVREPLLLLAYAYMRSMPEDVHLTAIETSDDYFDTEVPSHCLMSDLTDDEGNTLDSDDESEDDEVSLKFLVLPICDSHQLLPGIEYQSYVRQSPSTEGGDDTSQTETESSQEESGSEEDSDETTDSQETGQPPSCRIIGIPSLKRKIEHWRSNTLPIGRGTFSEAYLMEIDKGCEQEQAVAKVGKATDKLNHKKQFNALLKEMKQLSRLEHRGIVKLIGYEVNKPDKLVVLYLEYLHYSLKDLILNTEPVRQQEGFHDLFTPYGLVEMFASILDVLEYLRRLNILYSDLNSGNIRLTNDGVVKFIDFGTLTSVTPPLRLLEASGCYHLAPEIRDGEPATRKGQMYGVGLLIIQVVQGWYIEANQRVTQMILQWQNRRKCALVRGLIRNWGEFSLEQYSRILEEIAYPCCSLRPDDRLDLETVQRCLDQVMDDIDENYVSSEDDSSQSESSEEGAQPAKRRKVEAVDEESEGD